MRDEVREIDPVSNGQGATALFRVRSPFQRLLETLPAGAYTCDSAGLITYYNHRAEQLWGRAPRLNDPADRYCGSFKLFSPFGPPIQHDQCWMALALRTRREYNGHEIIIERPDGTRVTVLAHATPILDDQGVLQGAVNVLVDISDRKRMEEALREADRYKDEFLATLAHELRNPLTPIRNGVQILRLTGAQGPARERVLDTLERQVQHMVRLIDDLLEVSRISRGKLELRKDRVELASIIESALETARPNIEGIGLHLTVDVPSEPVFLQADPVRLGQVLANLLNNAAKFTPSGGKVDLVVERQKSEVLIRVRDSGVGIPKEMLPRIFHMFTQLNRSSRSDREGLGIGLTVVKSVVEMHGGTVSAQSAGPGQGSEFTVRLPLIAGPAGSVRGDTRSESGNGASKGLAKRRILIVDDNRDGAESLAMLLNFMGSDVRVAYNGPTALETMSSYRPDVVLLDIGMPGMDGYEVAGRVRRNPDLQDLTLIALTGWGQDEDRRRCRQAGFDHHLIKPLDLDALQTLLTSLPTSRGR